MDHAEAVQRTLDYIEEHLSEPVSNAKLAQAAGYSDYHFLRVFKAAVGMTPADYIRKRRISETVRYLSERGGAIADAAFACGFNSKENFVRAFKREHHILPTDFRAAQNSLKLYEKRTLVPPQMLLDPVAEELDGFQLAVYPSDEEYPPHFWNRYNANGWSKRLSGGRTVEDFGVSIWNDEQQKVDYFIGIRKKDAQGYTAGAVLLNIPGGLYVCCQTPPASQLTFVSTIHKTWDQLLRVWLPNSPYERTGGPEFEIYVEESRTYQERIYIPIRRKNG